MKEYRYTYSVPNDKSYIPTKTERNLLFLAYNLSVNDSDIECSKHSCFIIDEHNNVLCTNVNKKIWKNLPHEPWSIHAERGALYKFNKLYSNKINPKLCKLMVVRGSLNGETRNSRPCLQCYQDILESGIEEVIYTLGPNTYNRMYITPNYFTKKNQN